MISKAAIVRELAGNINDTYPDFVIGLPLFIPNDEIADNVIAYIRDNPNAKTDEVIMYLDKLKDGLENPTETY